MAVTHVLIYFDIAFMLVSAVSIITDVISTVIALGLGISIFQNNIVTEN